MRIDLAHQDLHFQLLLPAFHLHLLVQPHPDAVQHGIVGGHHPRDLLRALRLCVGVQIPGVCVPHGFFQLGHRDHEPPVEVQDQQRKHPTADRQNEDRLEIQLRGCGSQAFGRSQKHRCPRGRVPFGKCYIISAFTDAERAAFARMLCQSGGNAFRHTAGCNGIFVGRGDQLTVLRQDVYLGTNALGLQFIQVV